MGGTTRSWPAASATSCAGESAATNLGPRSKVLLRNTEELVAYWQSSASNPTPDLVTTSGSGYDPDITPQDAVVQIPMVSKATGISPSALRASSPSRPTAQQLGFLGSSYIDVLQLNEALAKLKWSLTAISAVVLRKRNTVRGEIVCVMSTQRPWVRTDAELRDATGSLVLRFIGRASVPGLVNGRHVVAAGDTGPRQRSDRDAQPHLLVRQFLGRGRLSLREQLVSDAWDGPQDVTVLIAELLAQPVGVDAHVVGLLAIARTPHVLEDHVVGADLAGVSA